jgi:hypothetical protein
MEEWWMHRYDVTVDMKKDGSHESLLHLVKNFNLKLKVTGIN